MADVVTALTARDELDRTRTTSPLYAAEDATLIDTTGKSVGEVVQEVLAIVRQIDDRRSGDRRSVDAPPITSR
jgi:CMP/dCMP kinase